jgi:hypothetical protein
VGRYLPDSCSLSDMSHCHPPFSLPVVGVAHSCYYHIFALWPLSFASFSPSQPVVSNMSRCPEPPSACMGSLSRRSLGLRPSSMPPQPNARFAGLILGGSHPDYVQSAAVRSHFLTCLVYATAHCEAALPVKVAPAQSAWNGAGGRRGCSLPMQIPSCNQLCQRIICVAPPPAAAGSSVHGSPSPSASRSPSL